MSQRPPNPLPKNETRATLNPLHIVRDVIVIGASAGGHSAVVEILSRLPQDLPAFIGVVIHRGAVSHSNWSHDVRR
jgi:chemotaxis response regulator CheB